AAGAAAPPAPRGTGQPWVPAVLVRANGQTRLVDDWIARRERIEAHPRRYWAWRMMMRPWNVFLAQVFQFQCQLQDALRGAPDPAIGDPCKDVRSVLVEAEAYLERLTAAGINDVDKLRALAEKM